MIFIYWEWRISIEATKICYFGLALFSIDSHPTRLPDVSNLKNFKNIRSIKLIFASIEATKNIIVFSVALENNLGQSVCRIFYFWLAWLVNHNTGGPLLHCTCCFLDRTKINLLVLSLCYQIPDIAIIVQTKYLILSFDQGWLDQGWFVVWKYHHHYFSEAIKRAIYISSLKSVIWIVNMCSNEVIGKL